MKKELGKKNPFKKKIKRDEKSRGLQVGDRIVPPPVWDPEDLLGSQRTAQEPSLGVLRTEKAAPRASGLKWRAIGGGQYPHPSSLRAPVPVLLGVRGSFPAPSPETKLRERPGPPLCPHPCRFNAHPASPPLPLPALPLF